MVIDFSRTLSASSNREAAVCGNDQLEPLSSDSLKT
jgi:hypothetical protein